MLPLGKALPRNLNPRPAGGLTGDRMGAGPLPEQRHPAGLPAGTVGKATRPRGAST